MVCRSRERADAARNEIVAATGNTNVHVHIVDMGCPSDIRRFVSHVAELGCPVHILVRVVLFVMYGRLWVGRAVVRGSLCV